MTIRSQINARILNDRLTHLERCAELAPEGSYEQTKEVAAVVGDASNLLLRSLRALGMKALNDDRLREVEAVIYGYILESNPDAHELAAAEGVGEHVDGPSGARILNQLHRDRDFLAELAGL